MPELRFAVVAADGRRSSVWRVWTQGDEAYLATRSMAGQVKISLHASGYCQHSLTQRVRDLMPLGEQAFDRWYQPQGEPGVLEPAYLIFFPGSELRHQEEPPPPSATLIPLSTDEHEVSVGVFKVRAPLPPAEDDRFLRHLARLDLRNGDAVDLAWVELPVVRDRVEAARRMLYDPAEVQIFPTAISKERDYAYGFGEQAPGSPWAGKRWAIEIAVDHSRLPGSGDNRI